MLDTEKPSSGIVDLVLPDPDHANCSSSTLWELAILAFHYHPAVQKSANKIASLIEESQRGPTVSGKVSDWIASPTDLYKAYDPTSGGFNPQIKPPSQHSLAAKVKKSDRDRFIHESLAYLPSSFFTDEILPMIEGIAKEGNQGIFSDFFQSNVEFQTQELRQKLSILKQILAKKKTRP